MMVFYKKSWLAMLLVFRGTAIQRIWRRILAVLLVAVVVTYLHEEQGMFHQSLTEKPFALMGLALGIFLGFRNNTSYSRFWEGRILWGRLVNTSRTFLRQVQSFVTDSQGDEGGIHRELTHRIIAYVHLFRQFLREETAYQDAAPFVEESELSAATRRLNPPLALLEKQGTRLRELWKEGKIETYHLPSLDNSLSNLTDIQGACERIKNTPIPGSYNVLIHRLVACYVFALPFGLVDSTGILTPFVVFLVAYAFLGIDAIGDEIEQPFGIDENDLPLATLSTMIEINLRQGLGETDLPEPLSPKDGLLL